MDSHGHTCLNRTSVGLKVAYFGLPAGISYPPQSNQRGIERTILTDPLCPAQLPQSNQRGIESE